MGVDNTGTTYDTTTETQPSQWAQSTWDSLLRIANTAVDNITAKNQAPVTALPAGTNSSWLSKIDAKQVALLIGGGILVAILVKKLVK